MSSQNKKTVTLYRDARSGGGPGWGQTALAENLAIRLCEQLFKKN